LHEQKYNISNSKSKNDALKEMTVSVEKAGNYLSDSNLEGFGNTLDETWQLKKSLSNKISASQIDDLYELARRNGA
jgi:D-glycero-alpha-D-manno-heptose-7-phosphate kinase